MTKLLTLKSCQEGKQEGHSYASKHIGSEKENFGGGKNSIKLSLECTSKDDTFNHEIDECEKDERDERCDQCAAE